MANPGRSETSPKDAQRFWCVENFSLADVLTPKERKELHRYMQFSRFEPGETIYFPGDPSETVYTLHKGHVRLAYLDKSGRRLTLAIIGRGQLFGETALSGEQQRRWIAEAMEETVLCMIDKRDLVRFMERNPALALRVNKIVGERLVEIENKLEELIFRGVHGRLAQTLLKLAERHGEDHPEGTQIHFKLTHEELGNLIGAARETTSAALGDLERDGLITKRRGTIIIRDPDELSALA